MKRMFLALALFSLLGCSSHPVARPESNRVPPGRRFESHLSKSSHRRSCAITIVREAGVSGTGLNLYLDGDQIARMAAGESTTVYVAPGRHRLEVKPLFSRPARQLLNLQQGEATTIRIIDRDGNYQLIIAHRAWYDSIGRPSQSSVR